MNRQQAAVARLTASRGRLRGVLIGEPGTGGPQSLLGTLVRDHPLLAAALSVLVGGLAVRLRPWRWLAKSGLWIALLPQVVSTLSKAPLGTWAESLMALLRRAEPAEPAAQAAAEGAAEAAFEATAREAAGGAADTVPPPASTPASMPATASTPSPLRL